MFKESAIKEGWYVDLVRDKCSARIKRDQKNQKAEPLMIAVPGFLSAVCSADELMLYPEVVGYAFEFTKSGSRKGEAVLHVERAAAFLGVVRQLIGIVLAHQDVVAGQANRLPPLGADVTPELKPLLSFAFVAKPLDFHLLELA